MQLSGRLSLLIAAAAFSPVTAVSQDAEWKALRREALLANPLLDFERILPIKRGVPDFRALPAVYPDLTEKAYRLGSAFPPAYMELRRILRLILGSR